MDLHREDERSTICGKLGIIRSILDAEQKSNLYVDEGRQTIRFSALANTWFAGFYELLTQGVRKSQIDSLFDNVSVINFNYDRCLEHFLVHALSTTYGVPGAQSQELVARLKIMRPYGKVGGCLVPVGEPVIPFGAVGVPTVDHATQAIRTYTEQIEDQSELYAMRHRIAKSEVIVFLGCAFHLNNMSLLTDSTATSAVRAIYYTQFGIISDGDKNVVQKRLAALRGKEQGRKSGTSFLPAERCVDLFRDYRLSLAHALEVR